MTVSDTEIDYLLKQFNMKPQQDTKVVALSCAKCKSTDLDYRISLKDPNLTSKQLHKWFQVHSRCELPQDPPSVILT